MMYWRLDLMSNPSCSTCKNFKYWFYPGTLEDPPEEGWGCSRAFDESVEAEEIMGKLDNSNDDEVMKELASICPHYEFFDWARYEYECDQAYAEQLADEQYQYMIAGNVDFIESGLF